MHQVAYRGEGRVPRRRHYREDDRDWHPQDDVWPYSMPHQSHFHEVQRPDDRAPRGYGRAPRNSRSLDAFHPAMPPPHLTRGPTDPYSRPRREILVYQDEEEEPPDNWRRPRTRETTPEYDRPQRPVRRARRRPPAHPELPSSSSPPSTTESEGEDTSEEDSDNEIEVEEFADTEPEYEPRPHRRPHRQRSRHGNRQQSRDPYPPRQQSRDDYLESSDSRRPPRRSRRRHVSPSDDEEIEVHYPRSRHSRAEIVEAPVTPIRQIISRRFADDSPKQDPQSRVTSVIESSRPPVASRRLVAGEIVLQPPTSDQRTRTLKIYDAQGAVYREGRPRRTASTHTREVSVTSSRRPPSLMGSNFGDSSRMSSPVRPTRLRDCTGCLSEVPASRCPKLECGHRKCHDCLKKNFEQSMTDPQHMPPACCDEPIPLQLVDDLLDASFKKKWNRKFAEYATQNRILCPSARCNEWIRPATIHRDRISGRSMGQCDRCNERVCISCKGRWHYPRKCSKEDEVRRDDGWSSCYKCDTIAKPREGHLHMHCRCGAQYCVVCGSKWKSCDCQWFGDDGEAEQREDRLVHTPRSRRGVESGYDYDDPASPGELRARRELPDIRPPPKSYEEEVMLQELQERRDEARKSQYLSEGEYEPVGGPRDLVPVRNAPAPSHYDPYRHAIGAPEVPGPPPPLDGRSSLERSPRAEYVGRSRRGQSTDRRLADRFSESRQTPGSMPGMEPPRMSHHGSPLMQPPLGPHPGFDGSYSGGRVIVKEHDPNDYRDDSGSHFSHSSQSRHGKGKRRARRRESVRDEPKPSVLAGLNGRGTGMGRVDVWRKYVEPGDFEGEIAAGARVTALA